MDELTTRTDAELDAAIHASDRELHGAVHELIEAHSARAAPLLAERDRRTRAAIDICRAEKKATVLSPIGIESAEKVSDLGSSH